jgi:hypothetical protein
VRVGCRFILLKEIFLLLLSEGERRGGGGRGGGGFLGQLPISSRLLAWQGVEDYVDVY